MSRYQLFGKLAGFREPSTEHTNERTQRFYDSPTISCEATVAWAVDSVGDYMVAGLIGLDQSPKCGQCGHGRAGLRPWDGDGRA